MTKKILMIAGPNGAGKTTVGLELMSNNSCIYEFINADEIAKGLAPLHPESMALTASKLMIERLKELLQTNKNFAFETTAAGTNYVKHLKTAQSKGYEIHLAFLWLSNPSEAIKRVKQRVKQGGHHIPDEVVFRRYHLGLKNLIHHYLPIADVALIIDNSSETSSRRLIARKDKNKAIQILDEKCWKKIEDLCKATT